VHLADAGAQHFETFGPVPGVTHVVGAGRVPIGANGRVCHQSYQLLILGNGVLRYRVPQRCARPDSVCATSTLKRPEAGEREALYEIVVGLEKRDQRPKR
jgi:hypothetical protein